MPTTTLLPNAIGNIRETARRLDEELHASPQDPAIYQAIAEIKRMQGDELNALVHLATAQLLEQLSEQTTDESIVHLCNIATAYFMQGNYKDAEHWYRLVLAFDPHFAIAYMNLTSIYATTGRMAEAEICRDQAYRNQRVFIEHEGDPVRRVLVLCVGRTSGNIPFEILLPTATCQRIKYVIDYAPESEDAWLPEYDLVFNAIGEADIAALFSDRLQRFVARCARPVLNPPEMVALTQRHRLAAFMGDIEYAVVMPCMRLDGPPSSRAALTHQLAQKGLSFPILIRPAGSHGGKRLERCATIETLEQQILAINDVCYLSSYCDYVSNDGYYRKYRVIYVDRKPYPYHLAISSDWKVHYETAEMEDHLWRIDEEYRFLQDPAKALGAGAMSALAYIGSRLDFDYGGIDFTLLPDGRVLVFEANPTMLVHREHSDSGLAHKNFFVQHIVDAFEKLLASL
ncbi:MAG TPA: tetratricopeptide repeat protein [Methylophilaceae bacterium]